MQNGSPATKAKNRYKSKAYDRIEFFVPKGQKGILQEAADRCSDSMNGFVNQAVLEKIGIQQWPADYDGARPTNGSAEPEGRNLALPDVQTSFGIDIMERLTDTSDLSKPLAGILESIRMFFAFGCAFVYEADHKGLFHLVEHVEAYEPSHLQEEIQLHELLGDDLLARLAGERAIIFPSDSTLGPLERAFEEMFDARSLILIPIKGRGNHVIAFVGLSDRRGMQRHQDVNMDFAYAMLCATASHIKLRIYQQRVESTQKSLESILDHMGVDIYVNDFETHEILYANRSMAAPYGGVESLMGEPCWQALYHGRETPCDYCPQPKLIDTDGEPTKVYSWDYQRPFDGAWFRVISSAFRWVDGRLAHVVSSVDISENKRNEELIRRLAEYDTLTELPNRRKLLEDCDAMLADAGAAGYMLFFDLDGFKQINDTMGHQAGDELLQAIGQYLEFDPLFKGRSYRHSGDEFVILAGDDFADVQTIIGRILSRFSVPWRIPSGDVTCNSSIGVAYFPDDGKTTTEVLNKADQAMYKAKQLGKGQARFYADGRYLTPAEYEAARG